MQEEQLHQCFQKNLAFFKEFLPNLYQQVEKHELKHTTIDGLANGEIDLLINGKSQYRKAAFEYANNEVQRFTTQLAPKAQINTVVPPARDSYSGKRYFFESITKTINKFWDNYSASRSHYMLDDHYPMLVVMGVGLGIHIDKLIENKDIHTLFIVENDIEKIIASCYITEWYRIIPEFKVNTGKQFSFILPFDAKSTEDVFIATWNELIHFAPRFPLTTLFYNHRQTKESEQVINRFHEDHHVFLGAWGNYDDELNQLNHGLHNLRSKRQFLKPVQDNPLPQKYKDVPVVVVGGGPSVDERIDWIKERRDDIFLISAGSALRTLAHYGLKPDLHAELESDYNTATMYEFIGKEYMEDLIVVGPIQLSPVAFNYFDQAKMFLKDSSAQISIFPMDNPTIIPHATPTCTNTALALAFYYEFSNIYVLGVDLSYKDISNTHAEGSIYFDPDAPDVVKHAMDLKKFEPRFPAKDIKGDDVLTEAIYFSTKRRIENGLIQYGKVCNVFNLSKGLHIEGTRVINEQQEFDSKIPSDAIQKQDLINFLFKEDTAGLDEEAIQAGLESLYKFVNEVVNSTLELLDKMEYTIKSFDKLVFLITHILERTYTHHRDFKYYFIRGAFWHYLYAGYGFAYAMHRDDKAVANMIADWKQEFSSFLSGLEDHLRTATQRITNEDDDIWLYRSIHEAADLA